MSRKRSRSLKSTIIKPMLAVLFCQAIIIFVTVLLGGLTNELKYNAYELLTRRSAKIVDDVGERFRNLRISDDDYNAINDLLNQNEIKTKDESSAVLVNVEENLVKIIDKSNVTGAFVILDNVLESSNEKVGAYIRKQDGKLVLKIGTLALLSKMDLNIGNLWTETFKFDSDNITYGDFYNKVVKEASKKSNINYRDYEYWSEPFDLNKDGLKSITYTLPLVNSNGVTYGVLGIEISIDKLNELLNIAQDNNEGIYPVVGYVNGDGMEAISLAQDSNKIYNIKITPIDDAQNIYKVLGIDINGSSDNIGNLNKTRIYGENSGFEKDDVYVLTISPKDVLFSTQSKLIKDLSIGLIIASFVGIIIVIITASLVTQPITKMVGTVKRMNPSKIVKIERVGITQMDALATSIENLSKNVADNASRLSKIIDLVNMPIGAFEYYDNSNMVYCTESFFKVVGVERDENEELFINMEKFKKILADVTKNRVASEKNVYCLEMGGNKQYIRVKMLINNIKTLGVIVDVTDDILKKQKIEYERDHDVLTGLYNRIAFKREVINYMDTAPKGKVAAFLMWDLDSLKFMNDTFGHELGDKYIKTAADSINKFSKYGGISGRVGGDEFTAFVGGFETKDEIRQIINKVKRDFEDIEIELPNGDKKPMRASMGVAWYPQDSMSYEELLNYADYAMYEVKKTTKGALKEFDIATYKPVSE